MSYIETAKKSHEEAVKEFQQGKKENDEVRIRDSAEKAWNAVVQATNHLFEKSGYPVPVHTDRCANHTPKNHHDRRRGLDKLAESDPKVREKGFRDRYMARIGTLHENCFYEGIYSLPLLEEDIQKVKGYIDDVEELLGG